MEKAGIRTFVKKQRGRMSPDMHTEFSQRISAKLFSLEEYKKAKVIYCYIDVNNEVGTREIIEHSIQIGKEVAVPKVKDNIINFYRIYSLQEVALGCFQIPEPVNRMIPDTPDIIIVPGVAFSYRLERMGYGGGYYDRFLKESHAFKLGIAFEFQMFEKLPVEKHDITMDMILTEKQRYQ